MVASDLELDRARRDASRCRVLSLSRCLRRLEQPRNESLAQVVRLLATERRIKKFLVPEDFPYGLARELRRLKIRLKIRRGALFFPEREFKTADEIKKVSAALMMAEVGMAEAIQAVRAAKVGPGGKLAYRGSPLTSERLRAITEVALIQAGGCASHTIVAGGRRTCDPHDPGNGPLRARQPIVIDIFPRVDRSGYFGDLTRTVVKGRATAAVRRVYEAVRHAQEAALAILAPGLTGQAAQRAA